MDFSRCCAIVGSASFDAEHFLAECDTGRFACVLAADGGLAHLDRIGISPDVALGDFDSLGYIPNAPCVERHSVMKDATDLELAFNWAWREGYSSAAVYGALGGRLDQTLATQQILVHFARCGMSVAAVGEGCLLIALSSHGRPRTDVLHQAEKDAHESKASNNLTPAYRPSSKDQAFGLRPYPNSVNLPAKTEGIVSVCAMGGDARGVTERGFLYEIEGAVLPCDSSLGISNELVGRSAHIEIADGDVLVFMPVFPLSSLT